MVRQNTLDRSGQANQKVSATYDPEQLRAVKRAIQDVGPAARKAVRAQLKEVGLLVRDEIRSRSPVYGAKYGGKGRQRVMVRMGRTSMTTRTGKHTAGLLKRSTKLKIGSLSVTVFNDARASWKGGWYRYGKRLEFDPSYSGRYAFFYPGFEAKKDEAMRAFDKVLEGIVRDFGRG